MNQRKPVDRAVVIELRDVQRSIVEQVPIRLLIVRIIRTSRHEFVDIVESFIVSAVNDNSAIVIDDNARALVLHAAERRSLDWR